LLLLLVFYSCGSSRNTPEKVKSVQTITKTIKEIQRDTVHQIQKDSSFYRALIECKNNKPVLKEIRSGKGRRLKKPSVEISQNSLNVDCKTQAEKLFFQWKQKYILEQRETQQIKTLPAKLIPRELTWWQELWIKLGKISVFLILGWLVSKVSWKNLLKLLLRFIKIG
jgi:hypothetical protein